MPTPTGHAVAAITAAYVFPRGSLPKRAWMLGALVAMAPDLDTLPLHLGIAHGLHAHRGVSHSLCLAAALTAVSVAAAAALGLARGRRTTLAVYLAIAVVSHGLLDTLTNGGSGVELLWPLSARRFSAPFRPIAVSPISVARFFTARGVHVVLSEFLWIGLPCLALAGATWWVRRRRSPLPARTTNQPR